MSVSKWAYEPEACDGEPCPGDCDLCGKANDNAARREERQGADPAKDWKRVIHTCAECLYWNYTMAEAPCRGCLQNGELTRWEPERRARKSNRKVETNLFDIVEEHRDCTVQILRNSVTGERSFAWYPNDSPPARIGRIEE